MYLLTKLPIFQVPIEAVPPPVTSWYQNDKELLTRDGLKVVHNPCMAKLMFIPALRPLSGKYLLKAKNQVRILYLIIEFILFCLIKNNDTTVMNVKALE